MKNPKWSLVRKVIIERDGACIWCGATSKLTVDHIIPKEWRGDVNGTQNLQTLCVPCHSKKYGAERYLVSEVMQEHLTAQQAKEALVLYHADPIEIKSWQRKLASLRRRRLNGQGKQVAPRGA